jgi:predicted N-acetyltransferase YhbS
MFSVFTLRPHQTRLVNKLRSEAFTTAAWEAISPELLQLAHDAAETTVLCVTPRLEPENVVATVALNTFDDATQRDAHAGAALDSSLAKLPALLISRLAVAPRYRGRKLSLVLQLHALRLASRVGAESVTVIHPSHAPGLERLRSVGFEFASVPARELRRVKVQQGVLLAGMLRRDRFEAALGALSDEAQGRLPPCEWLGPAPRGLCSPWLP